MSIVSKFAPIRTQLEANGWNVSTVELPSDIWWALDIWKLESVWRPVGKVLYLSLMLDPELLSCARQPNEAEVWSIALGNTFPTGMHKNIDFEVGIKRKFAERSLDVIEAANRLRDARQP